MNQTDPTQTDCEQYANFPEWWTELSLSVTDDGHVTGRGDILDRENETDVTVGVRSYDYERDGTVYTNHVPMVTVTDPDGTIREEISVHDSTNPQTAIKRGIQNAEWAYQEYR